MTIQELADQLREQKSEINHKSTLKVYNLLENNKKVFLQKMEADSFSMLLRSFENLVHENPKEYKSESYKREYEKSFELLLFYLDKVI